MEDKRNKRAKTAVTVETERELYSKELGFINVAKKLAKVNNENSGIKIKDKKDGLYAKIGI